MSKIYTKDFIEHFQNKLDLNKHKDTPCSWLRRLNIIKMSFFPKSINNRKVIPIKIPMRSAMELTLVFIWEKRKKKHTHKNS